MHMTPRTIVIGGLAVVLSVVVVVVFLPVAVFKPTPSITTEKYTALEQEGLELYKANGCMYCHSQFTRPNDHSTSRPSVAGQYVYDKPHQLGTLRTGPDLSNIGYKRGDFWEIEHLKRPRDFTPNSIMPSFSFLTDRQARAIVAYLNRLGNKQDASTDLMLPAGYARLSQPFSVTRKTWDEGRRIYLEKCYTCHGCAGKGDGPYAYLNNARPADLRQPRFQGLNGNFDYWRISEGVPGTVMPQWKQSLTARERWLVVLFVQRAFMDMAPHLTDEGALPATYAKLADPLKRTNDNIDAGKAIFVMNCAFCHGYGGRGDGPDARGLQPAPPDFPSSLDTYKPWVPADYFWRVSESLPMRAMPQWKYWFDKQQRWLVANYVRQVLIYPPQNAEPVDPVIPARIKGLAMPVGSDVMKGREVYFKRCFTCHGDAGQGEGPSAVLLRPLPANFTDPDLKTMPDDELFWKVTAGIHNAAMPQWGLLLSEEDRWNAIAYIKAMFVHPSEPESVSDEAPIEYQALESPWPDTPAAREQGKVVYEYCTGCHGPEAKGDGAYGAPLKPTPADLTGEPAVVSSVDWWYWRVDRGVVGFDGKAPHPTAMPEWRLILTDEQKWDVVYYARALVGARAPGEAATPGVAAPAPATAATKGGGK